MSVVGAAKFHDLGTLSRSFVPPYIPSTRGEGSCARSLAVVGGNHVSAVVGVTLLKADAWELLRSRSVRFVISFVDSTIKFVKASTYTFSKICMHIQRKVNNHEWIYLTIDFILI